MEGSVSFWVGAGICGKISRVIAEERKRRLGPSVALPECAGRNMPRQPSDDKILDSREAEINQPERREMRYALAIEIEVSGIDRNGEIFREQAVTTNVSEWGCQFLLSMELKRDDIISLRMGFSGKDGLAPVQSSPFQVVRVTRDEGGWLVGAWKLGGSDIWGTALQEIVKGSGGVDELRKGRTARRREPEQKDTDR